MTGKEEVGPDGEPLEARALEAQEGPSRLTTNRPVPAGLDPPVGAPDREPPRARGAAFLGLLRTPGFARLWLAQIISNVGDWAYVLAVATAIASRYDPSRLPRVMAIILGLEAVASAVVGSLVAGPIVDRFPRRRVMIVSDIASALAVGSLLVAPELWAPHLAAVALILGAARATFQPALMSSLPGLVPAERLVTANAVVTSTFHVAIMVGPMVGAVLVAGFGSLGAFALNAASFGLSAALLLGVVMPAPAREERTSWRPIADLAEGARFMIRSHLIRGVAIVMGLVLVLVAAHKPLELGLVTRILAPTGTEALRATILAAFTAAWGGGMVLGSALAPIASRRFSRERLLAVAVAVAGLCYLVAGAAPGVVTVAVLWVMGGAAAGVANVSYETLLQERTPDEFLGRTFAAVEAVQEGGYFLGAALVAVFGGLISPTTGFVLVGSMFLAVAALAVTSFREEAEEVVVITGATVVELPESEPVALSAAGSA